MGNFLTATVTLFAPMITKELFIPSLMHPYRWGGIPFKPPNTLMYIALYVFFNSFMIGLMAFISGLMTTTKQCQKTNLRIALKNSIWAIIFALLGLLLITLMPFIKSPIIALLYWLPYANSIVIGLFM